MFSYLRCRVVAIYSVAIFGNPHPHRRDRWGLLSLVVLVLLVVAKVVILAGNRPYSFGIVLSGLASLSFLTHAVACFSAALVI